MSLPAGAPYVVGVDAGGSTVRAAVAERSGRVRAQSTGTAANPNAVGPIEAVHQIRTAITVALARADVAAGDVGAVTVGLAGATRVLDDPVALADLQRDLSPAGLPVRPEIVLDAVAAFAAGTPTGSGRVLVAGTGSIAATVTGAAIRARAGGWGWLLGDEGSGFWLGREAVRHALGGGDGPLSTAVRFAYDAPSPDALLAAVYAAPPRRLASLGATVAELAGEDPAAADLVRHAAHHLLDLLLQLEPGDEPGPVVLAGAALADRTPIGDLVRAALSDRGTPYRTAGPAVVGPTWLALRRLAGIASEPAVHACLVSTASASTAHAASADCG